MVAGLIAARKNNNYGINGVSDNSTLYGFSYSGSSLKEYVTSKMKFKYAMALMLNEGVKIMNFSNGYDEVMAEAQLGITSSENDLKDFSKALSDFLAETIKVSKSGNNDFDYKNALDLVGKWKENKPVGNVETTFTFFNRGNVKFDNKVLNHNSGTYTVSSDEILCININGESKHIIMWGCRYVALPVTSTLSVVDCIPKPQ